MRIKKLAKVLGISLASLTTLLLFGLAVFVFNPFESSLADMRYVVPRGVDFFVRKLPRGRHSLSYRLRAEIPGRFSALPAVGYAMYAPELKGNSDEIKLVIED